MPPRKKLIVKLQLTPSALRSLDPSSKPSTSEQPSSPDHSSNPVISTAPSPSDAPAQSQDATPIPNEPSNAATPVAASDSTPAPTSLQVPANPVRRKGIPGPKPGSKRGPQLLENGMPKPRGKPGPKKKPRPGEPGADPSMPFSGVNPLTVPKLGPKANLGAINAGLRALDRTGKPTRKWARQPFALKSFTGVTWRVPIWRAPKKAAVTDIRAGGDAKSNGGSDAHLNGRDGDHAGDENGNGGGDVSMMDVSEIS